MGKVTDTKSCDFSNLQSLQSILDSLNLIVYSRDCFEGILQTDGSEHIISYYILPYSASVVMIIFLSPFTCYEYYM